MRKFIFGGSYSGATVYDVDAQAYFDANSAITLTADKEAINDYYVGLKADGVYSQIQAMYLPIWSSATNNKWNLVNPLDTDVAFRLSFFGGITHDANGITGNGTTGYADTHFFFDGTTALDSHCSIYMRTNSTTLGTEFGSGTSGGASECLILRSSTIYILNQCATSGTRNNQTYADSRGMVLNTRTSDVMQRNFGNGILKGFRTSAMVYTGGAGFELNIFRRGNANDAYSNKNMSFISCGLSLTDAQALDYYNRTQTLMTHFGLNV